MKRDMNLVRSLLLRLEALPMKHASSIVAINGSTPELQVEGYSAAEIDYHLSLLKEHDLIDSPGSNTNGQTVFRRLTWEGHDYLDAIRDDKVWNRTKGAMDDVGSWTFELAKDLAKGFIKKQIEDRTGVKI